MTRVQWYRLLMPDSSVAPTVWNDDVYRSQIENVRPLAVASSEIAIPDPKAFRSMSRAALLLSHICMDARADLAPYLAKSPYSVGVYAAVENGPIDSVSTQKIVENQEAMGFAEAYRKFRNAKMYLKQLPNLAPAQMGISLGLRGPMNVYTHSTMAGLQALDQAEWDLETGVVDAALVCTAHAFDDFAVIKRTRQRDLRCISEGAAALLIVREKNSGAREGKARVKDWASRIAYDKQTFFGISDPIINLLRGGSYATV